MITVIVYEGHVRVTHDGQTVQVAPGASLALGPPLPAPAPSEQLAVGGGPTDRERALEARIAELESKLAVATEQIASCDEVSCVLTNYEGACCAPFKAQTVPRLPETLDRAMISAAIKPLTVRVGGCATAGFAGTVKATFQVSPAGEITSLRFATTAAASVPRALASCLDGVLRGASFPATRLGGSFAFPFALKARAQPGCDADALKAKGDDHLATGMDAAALAAFEASDRCRPDPSVQKLAFMAACRSKNASKAGHYFGKLPAGSRDALAPICRRNGIEVTATTADAPACDAAKLKAKGDDHFQAGMDAAALAAYEAALRCKPDPAVIKLAYMAACRSKNERKAKAYFGKLPAAERSALAQVCIRNGISPD